MESFKRIYVICEGVKNCINETCLHHKPHLVGARFKRHCVGHCEPDPSECISVKQIRKEKLLKINNL